MTDLPPFKKPTEFELEILSTLWSHGDSTVRDVHTVLNASRKLGYTTVLKAFQVMTEKGLVHRVEAGKAHIYTPVMSEEEMQTRLLTDLSQKLFSGSTGALAMHALSLNRASDEELEQIQALIDRRKGMK
jgi:predicted transcriptional regulator